MENITVKFETPNFRNNMTGEHNKCHLRSIWLPRLKMEVLWNPIPEKYSLQWCSIK